MAEQKAEQQAEQKPQQGGAAPAAAAPAAAAKKPKKARKNVLDAIAHVHASFNFYLRLFRWARPYWTHLIALFLLGLLATPLALLVPLPLKIALDSGLGSKPLPHLIRSFVPAGFSLSPSSALFFAVGLLIAVTILAQIQTL